VPIAALIAQGARELATVNTAAGNTDIGIAVINVTAQSLQALDRADGLSLEDLGKLTGVPVAAA
jgi:hypothetical protein